MCFGGETKKNLFLGLCPKYPVFAQKTDFSGEKDILCPRGTKVRGEVTDFELSPKKTFLSPSQEEKRIRGRVVVGC